MKRVAVADAGVLRQTAQIIVFVQSVPALQWMLRATPYYQLGTRGTVLIDVQAPAGGALGGATFALGVRAAVRF